MATEKHEEIELSEEDEAALDRAAEKTPPGYYMGWQAAHEGEPFEPAKPLGWKAGWKARRAQGPPARKD